MKLEADGPMVLLKPEAASCGLLRVRAEEGLDLTWVFTESFSLSGPQPFWHQGPVSWKMIFSTDGVGMVSGWFKYITFYIVHFISIIITSAPPQIIRHLILEVGDPCSS